jgi:hypothetical protein
MQCAPGEERDTDDNCNIGDIEDGPTRYVNEVDDVSAKRPIDDIRKPACRNKSERDVHQRRVGWVDGVSTCPSPTNDRAHRAERGSRDKNASGRMNSERAEQTERGIRIRGIAEFHKPPPEKGHAVSPFKRRLCRDFRRVVATEKR